MKLYSHTGFYYQLLNTSKHFIACEILIKSNNFTFLFLITGSSQSFYFTDHQEQFYNK